MLAALPRRALLVPRTAFAGAERRMASRSTTLRRPTGESRPPGVWADVTAAPPGALADSGALMKPFAQRGTDVGSAPPADGAAQAGRRAGDVTTMSLRDGATLRRSTSRAATPRLRAGATALAQPTRDQAAKDGRDVASATLTDGATLR